MLDANQLQFGPGMVRFGREKKARIFQRLAQTGDLWAPLLANGKRVELERFL